MKTTLQITLFLCLFISAPSIAQEFFPTVKKNKKDLNFLDLQQSFREWSKGKDLDKEKGWKWYKRWEEFNAQRINSDGSLPDPSVNAAELIKVADLKSELNERRKTALWTPVGPDYYGSSTDPLLETGLHRINTISFHPTDPNTFWVGVAQGGIWKTVNNGQSWAPLTDNLPMLRISDIAVSPSDPQTMYISVGDFAYIGLGLYTDDRKRHTHYGLGVYKTTDGGETWNATGLSFEQSDFDLSLTRRVFIDPTDPDHVVASTTTGIFKSYDGGDNWTKVYDELIWDFERHPTDPSIIYAATGFVNLWQIGTAGVLKSTDFGETWTELNSGIPPKETQRIELSISPVDPNYIYAVACNLSGGLYGVYRTTDGGDNWEQKATSPNMLDHYDGVDNTTNGGGTYDLAILADPINKEKVYVGGVNMWGSEDGGATFNGVSHWINSFGESLHADLHYFAYNPLSGRYYVCNDGGLYSTEEIKIGSWDAANNEPEYKWPTEWQKMSNGINATSFYRLGLSKNHTGYVVAGSQDNSCFYYNNTEWRNFVLGDGMECLIHPDDPEDLLLSTQFGRLARSTDGGLTHTRGQEGAINNGEWGAWTTPLIRHPNNPEVVFGAWGNLWKSEDRGDTWSKVSNFANINGTTFPLPSSALAVSPADPDVMFLSKRPYYSANLDMELWKTTDGGKNWDDIRGTLDKTLFITSIAVDNDNPERLWITAGGFRQGLKVYKSENGGRTWINLSAGLANIPVNTITHVEGSLENFVYIGTDAGIYYRNDDMNEWALYSNGLPNVIVSELEVHKKSNKLYASTFGRGVWMVDLLEFTEGVEITGLLENKIKDLSLNVYPNPATAQFNLHLENVEVKEAKMEIIDVLGRRLYSEDLSFTGLEFKKNFDLDLKYGLYYIKISHGKFTRSIKFMVE